MKSRIMGLALYVAHMGWKTVTVNRILVENRKNESAKVSNLRFAVQGKIHLKETVYEGVVQIYLVQDRLSDELFKHGIEISGTIKEAEFLSQQNNHIF